MSVSTHLKPLSERLVAHYAAKGIKVLPPRGDGVKGIVLVGLCPDEASLQVDQAFSGAEEELLIKVLQSVRIDWNDCWYTYLVPFRPADGNEPAIGEVLEAQSWLEGQLALAKPKLILSLGDMVTRWFLLHSVPFTTLLGSWYDWHGIPLRPIHRLKTLLDNPDKSTLGPKYRTWLDMQDLAARLEELS